MRTIVNLCYCYALILGCAIIGAGNDCYAWGGRFFYSNYGTCQACRTCQGGYCRANAKSTILVDLKDDAPAAPCEAVEEVKEVAPCGAVQTCSEVASDENNFAPRPVRNLVNALVNRLNAVRNARGCHSLQSDANLEAEALAQCKRMAAYGCLFHSGGAPEICAINGGAGIDQALSQWTWSGAHFRILYGGYSRVGVASYRDAYGRNWCCARFR